MYISQWPKMPYWSWASSEATNKKRQGVCKWDQLSSHGLQISGKGLSVEVTCYQVWSMNTLLLLYLDVCVICTLAWFLHAYVVLRISFYCHSPHLFVQDHLSKCLFADVKCSYCGILVVRNTLPVHEADECLKRPVPCPYCEQPQPFDQREVRWYSLI